MQFELGTFKHVGVGLLAARLREMGYKVQWDGENLMLSHQISTAFLQNSYGIFLVEGATVSRSSGRLNLRIKLNRVGLLVFLCCLATGVLIQFFNWDGADDLLTLFKVLPYLITAALAILYSTVISTIRRDVKRAIREANR